MRIFQKMISRLMLVTFLFVASMSVVHAEDEYTPTVDHVTNVTSYGNVSDFYYYRVGNSVTVWGTIEIQSSSTVAMTKMTLSLPYAGHFTAHYQASGGAFNPGITRAIAIGSTMTTDGMGDNNTVTVAFLAPDTLLRIYYFHFSYAIQPE